MIKVVGVRFKKAGKIYYEAECKIWRISYAGYAFGYRTAYEEMP